MESYRSVYIQGVGTVKFPVSMSAAEVQTAIERDILPKYAAPPAPIPAPQAPPPEPRSGFIPALRSGVDTAQGSLQAMLGGIAELVGKKELRDSLYEAAENNKTQARSELNAPTEIDDIKKAYEQQGLLAAAGKVPAYLAEGVGKNLPQMAVPIIAPIVGGVVAGPPGVVAGLGAGFTSNAAMMAGQNIQRQLETPDVTPDTVGVGKAFATAIPQAALETVADRIIAGPLARAVTRTPISKAISALGKGAEAAAENSLRKNLGRMAFDAVKHGGKASVAEGATESLQQGMEMAQAGVPVFTREGMGEVGRAGLEGAILGGVMGGALGPIEGVSERAAAARTKAQEQSKAAARAQRQGNVPDSSTVIGERGQSFEVTGPDGMTMRIPAEWVNEDERQAFLAKMKQAAGVDYSGIQGLAFPDAQRPILPEKPYRNQEIIEGAESINKPGAVLTNVPGPEQETGKSASSAAEEFLYSEPYYAEMSVRKAHGLNPVPFDKWKKEFLKRNPPAPAVQEAPTVKPTEEAIQQALPLEEAESRLSAEEAPTPAPKPVKYAKVEATPENLAKYPKMQAFYEKNVPVVKQWAEKLKKVTYRTALRASEETGHKGLYEREKDLITVGLDKPDADTAFNEELMHSQWQNLKDSEKNILVKKAEEINAFPKETEEMYRSDIYKDLPANEVEDAIRDEKVAWLYKKFNAGEVKLAGKPRNIFETAQREASKLKNAMQGMGYQTVEDVIQDFEEGTIGMRTVYGKNPKTVNVQTDSEEKKEQGPVSSPGPVTDTNTDMPEGTFLPAEDVATEAEVAPEALDKSRLSANFTGYWIEPNGTHRKLREIETHPQLAGRIFRTELKENVPGDPEGKLMDRGWVRVRSSAVDFNDGVSFEALASAVDRAKEHAQQMRKDWIQVYRRTPDENEMAGYKITPAMVPMDEIPKFLDNPSRYVHRAKGDIRLSAAEPISGPIPDADRAKFEKVATVSKEKTLRDRVQNVTKKGPDGWGLSDKFRSAWLDQYHWEEKATRELKKQGYGEVTTADRSALVALRVMADRAGQFFGAAAMRGMPVYDRIAGVARLDKKNSQGLFKDLKATVNGKDVYLADLHPDDQMKVANLWQAARLDPKRYGRTAKAIPEKKWGQYKEDPFYFQKADEFAKANPWALEILDKYVNYNRGMVNFLHDTGVITKETRDNWNAGLYVPFYRVLESMEESTGGNTPSLKNVKFGEELKGGTEAVGDLVDNIGKNLYSAIAAGTRNVAMRRVMRDATLLGAAKPIKQRADGTNGKTVTIRVNGNPAHYEVLDENLLQMIEAKPHFDGALASVFAKPAAWLRKGVTLSPTFWVKNVLRDVGQNTFTSGRNIKPLDTSINGIVDSLKKGGAVLTGNQSWSKETPFEEALYDAGVTGGIDVIGSDGNVKFNLKKHIQRMNRADFKDSLMSGEFFEAVKGLGGRALEAAELASERSDAVTRAKVYEDVMASKRGQPGAEAQALYEALETLNFSRRGGNAAVRFMMMGIPFFNARLQGLDVIYRAAAGKGANQDRSASGKHAQTQAQFLKFGLMALPAVLAYSAVMPFYAGYRNANEEERDGSWLVPVDPFDENSYLIRFPMPFEVGTLFKALPERVWQTMAKETADGKGGQDTLKELAGFFARSIFGTMEVTPPQVIKPAVEVWANKDFFRGRKIEDDYMAGLMPEYRYSENTSAASRLLSKATLSKISPVQMDHLIRGYFGTMGSYMVDLSGKLADVAYERETGEKPSAEIRAYNAGMGSFFQRPDGSGKMNRFYSAAEDVDELYQTVSKLSKQGRGEEAAELVQENQQKLGTAQFYGTVKQQLGEYRKMSRQVRTDKNLSGKEKMERLKEIRKAMTDLSAEAEKFRLQQP